jgi:hypothetical protein
MIPHATFEEIEEGLKSLQSRDRNQVESKLKDHAGTILACLERNVPRKNIREYLASKGVKVSPTKFKTFIEEHVLPKAKETTTEALADARKKAKGGAQ